MPRIWVRIVDKTGNPLPNVSVKFESESCSRELKSGWSCTRPDGMIYADTDTGYNNSYDGHTFYVIVGDRRIGNFVFRNGLEETFRCP